jgi:hypothetical protein
LLFQGCPIRLGSPAAKILYVEASHAPILNERMPRLKLPLIRTKLTAQCPASPILP